MGLLQIKLTWTFACRILVKYPGVQFLGYIIVICLILPTFFFFLLLFFFFIEIKITQHKINHVKMCGSVALWHSQCRAVTTLSHSETLHHPQRTPHAQLNNHSPPLFTTCPEILICFPSIVWAIFGIVCK